MHRLPALLHPAVAAILLAPLQAMVTTLIVVVTLTVTTAAIELTLSPTHVEEALTIARAGAVPHEAFHVPYRISIGGPVVERAEVITEFRRLVLIADEHIARGDHLFARGTRSAEEALKPWRGKVTVVAHLRFDPRNVYVVAPLVELLLVDGSNRPVPRVDVRSQTQFVLSNGQPQSFQPVHGAIVETDYPVERLPRGKSTLVIRVDGKDVGRGSIDLDRLK